jgi:hypothetical protein
MKSIIVFLGNSLFLLSLCISFIGCDDGELYSKELVAFIRNWAGESYTIKRTYMADGTPSVTGLKELKFPVYLTREATVDVEAKIGADESLVAVYNASKGTDYDLFPLEALNISEKVTIPVGQLRSADSIKVTFDCEKLDPGKYLLPLTINSVISKDKGICASTTASTVYYTFTVSLDNINNAKVSVPEGNKIDRSTWSIICDDEPETGFLITNLIDGDRNTDWKGTKNVKGSIVVDMKEEHYLKGLSFYYHNGEGAIRYYDAPTYFQVYVSMDGEKWVAHGQAGRYSYSTSVLENEYGINFFVPVTCRYFKLKIDGVYNISRYGARFAELDAIK